MSCSIRCRGAAPRRTVVVGWTIAVLLLVSPHNEATAEPPATRVQSDLQVLYDFRSPDGPLVRDRAGVGEPLDLIVVDAPSVKNSDAGLEVAGKTLIRSEKPATRLIDAVKRSGAITIEAWIRPATTDVTGPARIVSMSRDPNERNFTLGQDADKFEVRLRTTKTSTNGMPAVASKPKNLKTEWTHVAYTLDRDGRAKLYIDGKLNVEQAIGGATSNWDDGFQLALANELTKDRPWQGTYRLVAVYSRNLSPEEVQQNYRAGRDASGPSAEALLSRANARLFETQVAPLFSKHCLECHDTLTKKGKLDLSRKSSLLAGGDSGAGAHPRQARGQPALEESGIGRDAARPAAADDGGQDAAQTVD